MVLVVIEIGGTVDVGRSKGIASGAVAGTMGVVDTEASPVVVDACVAAHPELPIVNAIANATQRCGLIGRSFGIRMWEVKQDRRTRWRTVKPPLRTQVVSGVSR